MPRVACIGEPMIELSMQIASAFVGVAGDTLNTAIYLKRSAPEIEVDYITRLGDDPFSTRIRDFIDSENLGSDRIAIEQGGSPGLYAITVSELGERSFTYWRDSSSARGMFSDGNFASLEGYDLIYLSGITLAILPPRVRQSLTEYLKNSKIDVAFDGNYRPGLWDSAESARTLCSNYWGFVAIPLPSIDDEAAMFGEDANQVEDRLSCAPGIGALKRGEFGPMSIGESIDQSYTPAKKVVDTTAAGDSFNGGYLAARLRGASQAEALLAGHDLATNVIAHRGAIIPR